MQRFNKINWKFNNFLEIENSTINLLYEINSGIRTHFFNEKIQIQISKKIFKK